MIKLPAGKNHAVEIERAIKQMQLLQDNVINNYIAPVVAPNIEALYTDCPDADNIIREDPDNVNLFEITDEDLYVLENSDCDKNTENVITGNIDDKELTHLALTRMADEDYYNGIEGLNTQQKTAFELVQSYFKTLADFNDGLINTKPEPVHIYISGPGRTGKSHLIRMIREMIIRSSLNNSTSQSPAVVAPTGIAAYNIEGITIHRALNLPVQHVSCPKYVPLKGERLSAMRKQWVYTNTVIID